MTVQIRSDQWQLLGLVGSPGRTIRAVLDISGAHHMVAGDANDAFNEAVFAFVDKLNVTRVLRSS